MEPYKIKHRPSGLYYQPGPINLGKRGKVYTTNQSVLSGAELVGCTVRKARCTPEQFEALTASATNIYDYGSKTTFLIHVGNFEKVSVVDEQEIEILFYKDEARRQMVKTNKGVSYIVVQLLYEQVSGMDCVKINGTIEGPDFIVTSAQAFDGSWRKIKLERPKLYIG